MADSQDTTEERKPLTPVYTLKDSVEQGYRYVFNREQNYAPFPQHHSVRRRLAQFGLGVAAPVTAATQFVVFPAIDKLIHSDGLKDVAIGGGQKVGDLVVNNLSGLAFFQSSPDPANIVGSVLSAVVYGGLTAATVKYSGATREDIAKAAKNAVDIRLHPKQTMEKAVEKLTHNVKNPATHLPKIKETAVTVAEQVPVVEAVTMQGSLKERVKTGVAKALGAISWTGFHMMGMHAASDVAQQGIEGVVKDPKKALTPDTTHRYSGSSDEHTIDTEKRVNHHIAVEPVLAASRKITEKTRNILPEKLSGLSDSKHTDTDSRTPTASFRERITEQKQQKSVTGRTPL